MENWMPFWFRFGQNEQDEGARRSMNPGLARGDSLAKLSVRLYALAIKAIGAQTCKEA
jgi:hypothetical protein